MNGKRGLRGAIVVAAAAAVAVTLAACGGGDDSEASPATTAAATTAAAGEPATTEAAPVETTEAGGETGADVECIIGFDYGNTTAAIYQNVLNFAKEEAEVRGCTLVEGSAAGDPAKQFDNVQNWVNSKSVTALVVLPLSQQLDPILKQAQEEDIVVVGYASEQEYGDAAILYDNIETGHQLATAAIQWTNDNFADDMDAFSYAIFTYDQCGTPCTERTNTVIEDMKAELGVDPVAEGDAVAEDTGLEQAESILQANPDLTMFLGVNDGGVLGAYKAFEEAGKGTGTYFLGGMDGQKEALELIAEGSIYRATSALRISEIGKAVVDLPADILETGTAENLILQPTLVDTPEEAQAFLAEEFGE